MPVEKCRNTRTGEIWRDAQGAYHADLKGTRRKWKADDSRIFLLSNRDPHLVPISTLTGVDPK
jgi:hypothetical protein